ncbi:hypothetical protein H4219_002497 [Mycoemilia scoparia]|uniref:Uncharacterized protein n=1 Tax=Mycoemilia scoparia TaxID=417184 RepID=A0A9W8A2D3_9FUNG|nr:hypothetical protein H4219_002497 [Mycoemilia scoparia]
MKLTNAVVLTALATTAFSAVSITAQGNGKNKKGPLTLDPRHVAALAALRTSLNKQQAQTMGLIDGLLGGLLGGL